MQHALRIIVADDDPALAKFYRDVCFRLGHEVCVAHTGNQLVEQRRLLRPDLILAGANLLALDGITAAEEDYADTADALLLRLWGHEAHVCRTGPEHLEVALAPFQAARLVVGAHDLAPFRPPAASPSSLANRPKSIMTEILCLNPVGLASRPNCCSQRGGGTGSGGCR